MKAVDRSSPLRRPISIAGEAAELYAIFGRWDDYLEIILPEKPELVEMVRCELAGICPATSFGSIDVRFHEVSPPMISVLALYVSAPEQRSRSHHERLSSILVELVRAVPALDFGDLLPEQSRPVPIGASEQAAEVEEKTVPAIEPDTIDPQPQKISTTASGKSDIKISLEPVKELARRGQVNKALRTLEGILQIQPSNYDAWKFKEELKLLERREKRRRREPHNVQAQLEVGFSYLLLDRNEEAADALARATKISPDQYLAHLLLGIAFHRQGHVNRARSAYKRAARLRPGDSSTHADLLEALDRGDPPLPVAETGLGTWGRQPPFRDQIYVPAV